MSVFERGSRYVKFSSISTRTDRRGRQVGCVLPARVPPAVTLGEHRTRDGQRLDHLADHYLSDATSYWRIADHNDAMTSDQIVEQPLLKIPVRGD